AFLIAILDFLIEPVAIRFDFWNWTDLDVPFQNYVAWFVFSFIMLRLFFLMRFQKINPAATIFFLMQFLFFFALNLKMLSKHF
ncbi:MAG: carotenoid biosynthesis protein, partial [Pyrinomonadaceae bacterium]|nr:carotenoid biosynthesis protein [Sphingobacteriaceae bacterium]